MLDAAIKSLTQIFSPPFRGILWKSIGLAVLLIATLGFGLQWLMIWLAAAAENWAGDMVGPSGGMAIWILAKIVSISVALGIVAGSVFLMPAVTALVASFFSDDIARLVEERHYPNEAPGVPLPLGRAVIEGVKTALLAVLVYLMALPFLLFAGFGVVIFFLAASFLLGREYFELAAMRFRPPAEVKGLRRAHNGTVFAAGMLIAAFVSIPVLNLATPLFGVALMVHMHKKITHA
jgi:CysZ protein